MSDTLIVLGPDRAAKLPTVDALDDVVLNPSVDLEAVCSGKGISVGDLRDTLKSPKPVTALVLGWRDDVSEACLAVMDAGVDILLVPPTKMRPEVAARLISAAARMGREIGIALNAHLARARALVESGKLGDPLLFNCSAFVNKTAWAGLDGCAAARDAAFELSLLQISHLLQSDSIQFAATKGQDEHSICCIVRLTSQIEGMVHVAANCSSGTGERVELYGTKGMLMLRGTFGQDTGLTSLVSAQVDVDELLANPTDPDKLKRRFASVGGDDLQNPGKNSLSSVIKERKGAPHLITALRAHEAAKSMLATEGERGWVDFGRNTSVAGDVHA